MSLLGRDRKQFLTLGEATRAPLVVRGILLRGNETRFEVTRSISIRVNSIDTGQQTIASIYFLSDLLSKKNRCLQNRNLNR